MRESSRGRNLTGHKRNRQPLKNRGSKKLTLAPTITPAAAVNIIGRNRTARVNYRLRQRHTLGTCSSMKSIRIMESRTTIPAPA